MSEPYYNIETPGVFSFNMLFLMSIAGLTLFEMGTNTLGIVLLIWGVFTALRAAWLLETLLKSQRGTVRSRLLPWIILSGMERRRRASLAKHAYRIFNWPLFLWFICAGCFAAGTLGANIFSGLSPLQENALPLIQEFFAAEGLDFMTHAPGGFQTKLMALGKVLLIGMAFFMAHTYAYTDHDSDRIWWGPFFLFILLALGHVFFYGFALQQPIVPTDSSLFMYLAGAIALWVFVHALRRSREVQKSRMKYAHLGLFCLLGLFICERFISIPGDATALWLSGWISVSALWVRALGDDSKKYLLYQI